METLLCQNETTTEPLRILENKEENVKGDSTNDISSQNGNDVLNSTIIKSGKVYLITNLINNKKYVGVTTKTLKRRWWQHCSPIKNSERSNIIKKAIIKYGKENFKIELIEEFINITEKELFLKESYYINKYNTFVDDGQGYNVRKHGDGKLIFSKITIEKLSKISRGKNNFMYGKHHTEKSKKKISEFHKRNDTYHKNFCGKPNTNLKGEKHPNADLTIRTFLNIKANETFCGNRYEFIKQYNLKRKGVAALIHGRLKSLKGWILIEA